LGSNPSDLEEISVGTWSLSVGYFQTVRMHHGRSNQQENDGQACVSVLAVNNVHILNLQRFLNSFDFRDKLKNEDIENVCQKLVELELR
jgi:hypothetical protein